VLLVSGFADLILALALAVLLLAAEFRLGIGLWAVLGANGPDRAFMTFASSGFIKSIL
jgi:hypothetical protein